MSRPAYKRFMAFMHESRDRFVHVGAIARWAQISRETARHYLHELEAAGELETGPAAPDDTGDQRRTGTIGYRLRTTEQETGIVNHTGADGSVHSGPGGLLGCRECERDRAEAEAAALPDSEGIDAIIQAWQAMAAGTVPVPEGDLITAAMWHLATEGVTPRLERLALAGALVAIEIDRMEELSES